MNTDGFMYLGEISNPLEWFTLLPAAVIQLPATAIQLPATAIKLPATAI